MSKLQAGYAVVNINPPLGIRMRGYFIDRTAKGFYDDLTASALVLNLNGKTIAICGVDLCSFSQEEASVWLDGVEKATGISKDCVFLTASHTHTGPFTSLLKGTEEEFEAVAKYNAFVGQRLADVVAMAMQDMHDAKMGYCTGWAPERVAYIRRYKMKDGSTLTCPPINDPNIDHPIGELDQRVHVVRIDREGAKSIVLMNYGVHADTTNGEIISADWPHWMRKTIKDTLDAECMFLTGCEGDVGSTHVFPAPGDMNDTEISFDNEMKSPGMARFVGRALAGTILQVYDKVAYFDVDDISIVKKTIKLAANVPTPEEMPLARKYKELHESGRDCDIPFVAMQLTTAVADAMRKCRLENGPEFFEMTLTGLKLGSVALLGIPGEPFTDIGVGIKEAEGWDMIMPCALTNGSMGYFPMQSAFDEGGYEACTSNYKAGVAEAIIEGGKALLDEMRK